MGLTYKITGSYLQNHLWVVALDFLECTEDGGFWDLAIKSNGGVLYHNSINKLV